MSKHPNVLDGIQDFINEMEVVQSSENRIVIESDSHPGGNKQNAGLRKTPQWLLTAYAKKNATGGSSDIDPEPNQGKQNGTAPLQGNSSSKDRQCFGKFQGTRRKVCLEVEKNRTGNGP